MPSSWAMARAGVIAASGEKWNLKFSLELNLKLLSRMVYQLLGQVKNHEASIISDD